MACNYCSSIIRAIYIFCPIWKEGKIFWTLLSNIIKGGQVLSYFYHQSIFFPNNFRVLCVLIIPKIDSLKRQLSRTNIDRSKFEKFQVHHENFPLICCYFCRDCSPHSNQDAWWRNPWKSLLDEGNRAALANLKQNNNPISTKQCHWLNSCFYLKVLYTTLYLQSRYSESAERSNILTFLH